ncbi:NAD(P)H-binding protein [Gynuella sp.]|uniref:NAD(P)H-binding protein n=1 Tax=Gynuella sp. TaxID=2969146 RepID=UPI003D0B0E4B
MILITGASGHLSSLVTQKAREIGLPIITASRASGSDRRIDFDQPETLNFADVDTLFLTSAGYAEDDVVIKRHGNVIAAARAQGVKHIIYTSLSYTGDHLGFALAHRWTEQKLRESGMAWTILRNGLYAELIGTLAAPREGQITAPFGSAGISAVAREDLADAAITVLRDVTAHVNTCYELSGVKPFSIPDLAQRIGIPYEPTNFAAERTMLDHLQLLPFQPPMLMSIYASAMSGFLETGTSDLMTLVPRPKDALMVACSSAEQRT